MVKPKRTLENRGIIDGGTPFEIKVTGRDKRPAWKRMYQNPHLGDTSRYYNSDALEDVISFVPGIGDAVDGVKAVDAANRGNYLEAGILGTGLLLPNIVEKPLKAIGKATKIGKKFKNYIDSRITRQSVRNTLSKAGDAAIHIGVPTATGYYVGNEIDKKVNGEYPIGASLLGLSGLGLGVAFTRGRKNLGNKIANDIIYHPVETAIETVKGKYPYTAKQAITLDSERKHKILEALKRQGFNNDDELKINILDSDKQPINSSGSYFDGLIKLNSSAYQHSNLPMSYALRMGDIEDVAAHEFRHHIQNTNDAVKYSRLADRDKPMNYYHVIDYNKYDNSFKPLEKNQGEWEGSPDEVDAELSFVQNVFKQSPTDMPNDKGLGYISDRFGLSKKETENIVNHFINNRINYSRLQRRNGGSIHIAPSKRGTFTAAATKHGMGVQEFANKVLRNKQNYSPAMVKKANFARNASKWN